MKTAKLFPWLVMALSMASVFSADAQTITVGSQCSRPGPINDNHCTVMYRVSNNPANNIVCLWKKEDNSLIACEGRTLWGAGYDYIPPAGATLEFRHHSNWPQYHPLWPDRAAVRLSGPLLKSQFVTSRYRASPTASCNVVVSTAQNIQTSINAAGVNKTICLAPGVHTVASTIKPKSGQTLRSEISTNPAVLRSTAHNAVSVEANNVTLKNFRIEPAGSLISGFGVVITGVSNVLMDKMEVSKARIGIGVTNGSSNIEVRESEVSYAGDGLACNGCADPSIWINNSNDVRVTKSTLINNGLSPQGDGELACYNTPGLVVTNTTVNNSGASGMYIVNCDYAIVSGNDIISAGEWGLDVVDTGQPSGSDYGLFSWNLIKYSRHAAGVLLDSKYNTFQSNSYISNRTGPNASGSCNGINRRGNTTGYYYINDVSSPWPVVCND